MVNIARGRKVNQKERIRNTVLEAIDELNEQLPSDRQLGNSNETALFGKSEQ